MSFVTSTVTYFAQEGRDNLDDCLRLSFEAAILHGLEKIVIFTAVGQGIQMAIEQFLPIEEFAHIKLVAVTFPNRALSDTHPHREMPNSVKELLHSSKVPLVKAHLPFDSISPQHIVHGVLAQDMGIVGNAFNVFCGSMSLCIQAVVMACDAGEVQIGEHIVVMTSDTSMIVRAAPTASLLTDLIVRQIVCKPAFLTVSKGENLLMEEPFAEQEELPLGPPSPPLQLEEDLSK